MARPSSKKPAPRRAHVAPKVKAVEAARAEPKPELKTAAPAKVEWPVAAAKSKPAATPPSVAAKVAAPALKPAPAKVAASKPVVAEPASANVIETVAQAAVIKPVEAAAKTVVAELKPAIDTDVKSTLTETAAPKVAPTAPFAAKTKGTHIMTDAMETAKTYAEEAKTRIQSAVTEINDKTKVAMEKSSKAFEEMGDIAKGNLEALVESSKIAAKGVETIGQDAAEFSRKSFEKTTATMKSFAAIKSPAEFFQLQSELLSSTLDAFASEAAKNSEAMLKLAGEVTQPLSNRVAIVSEKMKALAA